jgi:hypothetical protein
VVTTGFWRKIAEFLAISNLGLTKTPLSIRHRRGGEIILLPFGAPWMENSIF